MKNPQMRAVVSIILWNILLEWAFVTVATECSVNWSILTKRIKIGQNLQLECDIGDKDLCQGNPRWSGGPDNQIISVGNVVYNQEKYNITIFPGKYIMTIRDIRKADLSSRYICHVKFDKFEAIIKDKEPTYSLNISQPKSLQGDLRIFANISAVPLNRTKNQHRWLRYSVHNSTKTEDLPNSEKFNENMEDDGISLTVKNLTKKDVNMTYELIYSDAKFSGDVILQLISTGSSLNSSSDTFWNKWPWIIAGTLTCLTIIFIILGIKMYMRKKKTNSNEIKVPESVTSDEPLLERT